MHESNMVFRFWNVSLGSEKKIDGYWQPGYNRCIGQNFSLLVLIKSLSYNQFSVCLPTSICLFDIICMLVPIEILHIQIKIIVDTVCSNKYFTVNITPSNIFNWEISMKQEKEASLIRTGHFSETLELKNEKNFSVPRLSFHPQERPFY